MVINMQDTQEKVAIIVAPNGARKTKLDHSALPISKSDIVSEVLACRDAGAAMVHLHARDKNGHHSLDIKDNLAVLEAVKVAVGDSLIIQLTTEAVGQYQPIEQMALIRETLPEAASFAIKELVPDNASIAEAGKFFHWVCERGIIAQYILYSVEDFHRYMWLVKEGVLPDKHHHILLVLGRYHKELLSTPTDLLPFFGDLDYSQFILTSNVRWASCAFGVSEQKCLLSGMLMGGDVRVGFENNHFTNTGDKALSNAHQVADIKIITDTLNIPLHNAASFRQILLEG